MKLRLTFRFLVLFLLSTGALFALSNQAVEANCVLPYSSCVEDCFYASMDGQGNVDVAAYNRCKAACLASEMSCAAYVAWQNYDPTQHGDFTGDLMILNEPDPACAMYPGIIDSCGGLPTAEEIEACIMMAQQEQAKFHCP